MRTFRASTGTALLVMASAATLTGCASVGATFRSGVGDSYHDHAPYYAGVRGGDSAVAHLPVQYQRGGSHSAMFDPAGGPDGAVARLLNDMNAFLDSMATTPRLTASLPGTPADVQFGCELDVGDECTNGPAAPFEWGKPRMRLAVGRPSGAWTTALAEALEAQGAARALVITLEVGQYWPQQTNWRGSKALELGTGYRMDLPWLTSLETPVSVLQLTGALVGRDGRAVRIGAEGLSARRTGIVAAGLGAQALITEEDVEQLRTLRREDLPGKPLVWQVALRTLVADLMGESLSARMSGGRM